MDNTLKLMVRVAGQQVYRARFSAISAPEIVAAMVFLLTQEPFHHLRTAASVDSTYARVPRQPRSIRKHKYCENTWELASR